MNTPIMLAILALISGGLVTFIWKVAGANQVYVPSYMLVETMVFGLAAILIHLVQRHPFDLSPKLTGIGVMGGILAAISVYAMLLAFRLGGQGSIIFPIAGLGVIVAVILSYIVYREPITATKMVGLGLGLGSIIALSR
jgi:uncharacterized membrane protein